MKQIMKTFLHGTSFESGRNILEHGLIKNKGTVWTCSDPDMIYCRDIDDADYDETLFLSIESGRCAAAYQDSKSTQIAVVRIEIEESIAEGIVEEDNSCPNMYECYQIDIDTLNELIVSGTARLYVDFYEDAYIPYMRIFYIAWANDEFMSFDDPVLTRAKKLVSEMDTSYIMDDLMCYGEKVETSEYVPMKSNTKNLLTLAA